MGRLGNLWYWLAAKDPALDADKRISRWANTGAIVGIIATVIGWVIGWILDLPWAVGLFVGLVAWVVVLNGLVALGRRSQPNTAQAPPVGPEVAGAAPQASALAGATPQQAVDWRSQRFSIPTTEDARGQFMTLVTENEQSDTPDPLIELLADSERSRTSLRAERDEARAERETHSRKN